MFLFNEQFLNNNYDNIKQFIAVRQSLAKTVLRVLALYINYGSHSNTEVDQTFYLAAV